MLRIVRSAKITPELLSAYIAFHHCPHVNGIKGKAKEWYEARLKIVMETPGFNCHVIKNGKYILGIAIISPVAEVVRRKHYGDIGEVKSINLWIDPKYRRLGVAKQFLKSLGEEYNNLCWIVGANNFDGERFIQSQSFSYMGKLYSDGTSTTLEPVKDKALSILKHYFRGDSCGKS